jgi:ankyrin repeat protein
MSKKYNELVEYIIKSDFISFKKSFEDIKKAGEEFSETIYLESRTLLCEAIISGNIDFVKYLTKIYPKCINHPDFIGYTPLHVACINSRLEIINHLLESGANPKAREYHEGEIPIFKYTFSKDFDKVVEIFILNGFDVNLVDRNSSNIMHHLASNSRIEIVKKIIDYIPPETLMGLVNAKDCMGNTPLYYAAKYPDNLAAKYLKDKYSPGSDISASVSSDPVSAAPPTDTYHCIGDSAQSDDD